MNKAKTTNIFFKGLFFSLPILLTFAIIGWAIRSSELVLAAPLKALMPEQYHFPGMGILLALMVIYLVGLAIHGRVIQFVFNWMQASLTRLPVVSAIYNNIKEMIDFVSGAKDEDLERVVLVTMDSDIRLIGFVTQQDSDILGQDKEKLYAIYLPMSYQMGGYLIYVPESRIQMLEITKREAMRRIITADISSSTSVAVGDRSYTTSP